MFNRRKREPAAPDQDAVVDRVLCISAVAMLGAIATGVEEGAMDEGAAAKYVTETHRWLIREKLAHALSSAERTLLAKPQPEWTQDEVAEAGWRNESMGVLLWAIGALEELPPYDVRFERLPSFVPLLAPTSGFRATASLRSPGAIEKARGAAELWHWRARARHVLESDDPRSKGRDLDAIACQTATLAFAEGSLPEPIDGDFPAYGKPFRALDADEYAAVTSSAVERHHALNWLAGRGSDWDAVPTDT
ncbi:MAG: hypothetical protein QOF54_2099 [Solirubrobacteraceae bacterium]|nr:hypothetical protein [Solirubrobacteraceae bacterium]